MTQIFLDTGYIIALEATDDEHHEFALSHWRSLTESLPSLVTTSYIFATGRGRHILQQPESA